MEGLLLGLSFVCTSVGSLGKVNEAVFYGGPLLMTVPVNAQGEGDINLMRFLVLDNEL
jgi:hypothetical protein